VRISWGLIFALLWLYRSAYSFVGQVLVIRLTTLGDSSQFQRADLTPGKGEFAIQAADIVGVRTLSTLITEGLGVFFFRATGGSAVLINICFQTIAFVGIVVFLRALPKRMRVVGLVLLMLPSFTLWSSIASKEAIVVLAVGLLGTYVIREYRGLPNSLLLLLFALVTIYIFKNQYLPAILFLVVGTWICRRVRQVEMVALLGLIVSLVALYIARDQISQLALSILPHFLNVGADIGRATREAFWVLPQEVFTKAPQGMLLSFFGPTFEEAQNGGLLQRASFAESALLVGIFAVVLFVRARTMPVYSLFLGAGTIFWIMFANYPFGVMNPGSAIRYRTGYEMILILVLLFVFSRSSFVSWRVKAGVSFSASNTDTKPARGTGSAIQPTAI
jgi:hypothetical protein